MSAETRIMAWITKAFLMSLIFMSLSGISLAEDDLYAFCKDQKCGYIDVHGAVAIPATFDYAADFHNGRAVVKLDDTFGYIDAKNQVVIP